VGSVERLRQHRNWFLVGGCWFLLIAIAFWVRDDFTEWPAFVLGAAVALFGVAIWMQYRITATNRLGGERQQPPRKDNL